MNAAIVGELRQVPMRCACAAVRRCWKVFGAKEKPHCVCFSACLSLFFFFFLSVSETPLPEN